MTAFQKLLKKLSYEAAKWAMKHFSTVLKWLDLYSVDKVAKKIYDAIRR
ncbi:aureocin A53 family class IId bacteriocin [Virgibacillus pantothenticus]|nr:aureocin A53 family class IId bacteriocin [Virgibacillus pantothenticus]